MLPAAFMLDEVYEGFIGPKGLKLWSYEGRKVGRLAQNLRKGFGLALAELSSYREYTHGRAVAQTPQYFFNNHLAQTLSSNSF